jgi:hypothetical protein
MVIHFQVILPPQNISQKFVLKPNDIEFNKFYGGLNDLERYFLSKNTTKIYI